MSNLPEEIYTRIIYNAVLSELIDITVVRTKKKDMLYSLLYNTHCSGCGRYNLVCLRGYVGQYCNKGCWNYFHNDTNSDYDEDRAYNLDYIYEKYKHILDDIDSVSTQSRAISKRHRAYYNSLSPSGKVWPMCNKPCYNECVMNA
jgi:hypothetical protein